MHESPPPPTPPVLLLPPFVSCLPLRDSSVFIRAPQASQPDSTPHDTFIPPPHQPTSSRSVSVRKTGIHGRHLVARREHKETSSPRPPRPKTASREATATDKEKEESEKKSSRKIIDRAHSEESQYRSSSPLSLSLFLLLISLGPYSAPPKPINHNKLSAIKGTAERTPYRYRPASCQEIWPAPPPTADAGYCPPLCCPPRLRRPLHVPTPLSLFHHRPRPLVHSLPNSPPHQERPRPTASHDRPTAKTSWEAAGEPCPDCSY